MNIKVAKNKIYFKDEKKSYLNITLEENTAKFEILKVEEKYRNRKLATKLIKYVLSYIKNYLTNIKNIELSPLPIGRTGLSLDLLIIFYEKFGFEKRFGQRAHEPYLMVKSL